MSEIPAAINLLVSEVGPRDGLQSIKRPMATPANLDWFRTIAGAGLREIEVGPTRRTSTGNISPRRPRS